MEITTRHKDKVILYWFGPLESKTLCPVLRFVLLAWRDYMATCPREDALARLILGDGQSRWTRVQTVTTWKPMSSQLQHGKHIRAALTRLDCLVLHVKFVVVLNEVIWGIFWKVFRRSCGLPTRSVGPTNRSACLLVGRTYLLGMAVSLVGGDPGVPMYHKPPSEV
jgi:hypothetical protein